MTLYQRPGPPRPPPGRGRNATWLWTLATFSALLLCSGLALAALALTVSGQLPRLGAGPSWTPPPLPPPAAAPESLLVDENESPPPAGAPFQLGDWVRNANAGPVNLRRSAGYQGKPAADVIATVAAGATGEILGGPQTADGLRWWLVRFAVGDGWMAERSSSGKVLLDRAP